MAKHELVTPFGDSVVDEDANAVRVMAVGGMGSTATLTLASGVTTDTTSSAVLGHSSGPKTFFGRIVGTGAIAQTQAIYGNATNDTTGGVLLCTLSLSGTTQAQDAIGSSTAPYPYYYVVTTGTSGTGTSGTVYILY